MSRPYEKQCLFDVNTKLFIIQETITISPGTKFNLLTNIHAISQEMQLTDNDSSADEDDASSQQQEDNVGNYCTDKNNTRFADTEPHVENEPHAENEPHKLRPPSVGAISDHASDVWAAPNGTLVPEIEKLSSPVLPGDLSESRNLLPTPAATPAKTAEHAERRDHSTSHYFPSAEPSTSSPRIRGTRPSWTIPPQSENESQQDSAPPSKSAHIGLRPCVDKAPGSGSHTSEVGKGVEGIDTAERPVPPGIEKVADLYRSTCHVLNNLCRMRRRISARTDPWM